MAVTFYCRESKNRDSWVYQLHNIYANKKGESCALWDLVVDLLHPCIHFLDLLNLFSLWKMEHTREEKGKQSNVVTFITSLILWFHSVHNSNKREHSFPLEKPCFVWPLRVPLVHHFYQVPCPFPSKSFFLKGKWGLRIIITSIILVLKLICKDGLSIVSLLFSFFF